MGLVLFCILYGQKLTSLSSDFGGIWTFSVQSSTEYQLTIFFFLLLLQGDFKSQKEAAWAVTNLTSGGTVAQIIVLCQYGVIKPMCELLGAKDDKVFSAY